MIIYIDENLPRVLAQGFNILQKPENIRLKLGDPIDVKSILDEFGSGAQDETWIPQAGKEGACIITQDYQIKRIRHQRELCEKYNLGMFYFRPPSKGGFTYWDMVKMMVIHWQEIIEIASREKRPFSFKATSRSGKLERLEST